MLKKHTEDCRTLKGHFKNDRQLNSDNMNKLFHELHNAGYN